MWRYLEGVQGQSRIGSWVHVAPVLGSKVNVSVYRVTEKKESRDMSWAELSGLGQR